MPPLLRISTKIINRIPAQRARILVTALEPFIQTRAMEQILARRAPLIRHALIRRNHAVANCTLALALERAHNVALKHL